MANGFEVQGLILIDSPNPIDHEPLPNEVITNIINPSNQTHALNDNAALRKEFQFNASLLRSYTAVSHSKPNSLRLKTVMLRSQDVFDTESLCGVRYDWLSNQDARAAAIAAWEGLVGGHVEVLPIPGNHFEAFSQKNVSSLSFDLPHLYVLALTRPRLAKLELSFGKRVGTLKIRASKVFYIRAVTRMRCSNEDLN